jgi:hypothetical protein
MPNPVSRKDQYEQACEDFRSLNKIFWQIPILAMTLNGSVGFALGSIKVSSSLQYALLLFVFICDLCFMYMLWRLRAQVMEDLLVHIRALEGRKQRRKSLRVLYVFLIVFGIAAGYAFYVAHNLQVLVPENPPSKSELKTQIPTPPQPPAK